MRLRTIAAWLACLSAALLARAALADPPLPETGDNTLACHALEAKNDKELAAWSKTQPSTPYKYPTPDAVLDAPWGSFLSWFGTAPDLLAATLLPHVGAQLRGSEPAVFAAWPWSFPIGPRFSCMRQPGTFAIDGVRAHRILFEPGVYSGDISPGVFVRPGYRFMYHPTDWVVGAGAGLGTTIEIAGNQEPFRLSLSPELVAHFGHCCSPSYFSFAFRYDRYFEGREMVVLSASLGYTYF